MRIAAVICEYDPFHNGHALHLVKTRDAGAQAVVAIMSGNFTQRGEPAAFSKWARAEAAVRCGVDLVVELPVYWAAARAQRFARGGVSIVHRLGCVDLLSFGSECGDVTRIRTAAQTLETLTVPKRLLDDGTSFAAAREQALRDLIGDGADVLRTPNDTLAVEYCMAARQIGASFDLLAVPRTVLHDGAPDGDVCAASYIRQNCSPKTIDAFCPSEAAEALRRELAEDRAPADMRRLERMLLARLRLADPAELSVLPDVSEGLENRILHAARQADSLDALCALVRSKRYPYARIRRILLSYLLGIREEDVPKHVPYLRILAIGNQGEALLRQIKKTADLPILSRTADVSSLGPDAERVFAAECAAAEWYAAMQPHMRDAGSERTTPVYKSSCTSDLLKG